ncbi:hypothetical protein NLJ89_g1378 [Agrocybe chaxingu]|uniref:Nephrocystin 3-like N-terminal domain-containing protein n=1 Tax=Agrocybe chaxingu TaxID=84603 RepID=A0A9W8N060_9AGAR|nr:hypothetical protein NLJ89_g1378 [Agrocybe chaxingu]
MIEEVKEDRGNLNQGTCKLFAPPLFLQLFAQFSTALKEASRPPSKQSISRQSSSHHVFPTAIEINEHCTNLLPSQRKYPQIKVPAIPCVCQSVHLLIKDPKSVIDRLFWEHIAHFTTYDSYSALDPPRCHRKTRVRLLKDLRKWMNERRPESPCVAWVSGSVGVGKTALARTLAEKLDRGGLLAASFMLEPDRQYEHRILPTIAHQMILSTKEVQPFVVDVMSSDPTLFSKPPEVQFWRLVVEPFVKLSMKETGTRNRACKLVMIDGLDVCQKPMHILRPICDAIPKLEGRFKFIIFSRPEHRITSFFEHDADDVGSKPWHIDLDHDPDAIKDVMAFLQARFDHLKRTHPLGPSVARSSSPISIEGDEPAQTQAHVQWPGRQVLRVLVRRSSSGFIYPSIAMDYISEAHGRPQDRLDVVLDASTPSSPSGQGAPELIPHSLRLIAYTAGSYLPLLAALAPSSLFLHTHALQANAIVYAESLARAGKITIDLDRACATIAMGCLKVLQEGSYMTGRCQCEMNFSCEHSVDCEMTYRVGFFWASYNTPPDPSLLDAVMQHDPTYVFHRQPGDPEFKDWIFHWDWVGPFLQCLDSAPTFKDTLAFSHHLNKLCSFLQTYIMENLNGDDGRFRDAGTLLAGLKCLSRGHARGQVARINAEVSKCIWDALHGTLRGLCRPATSSKSSNPKEPDKPMLGGDESKYSGPSNSSSGKRAVEIGSPWLIMREAMKEVVRKLDAESQEGGKRKEKSQ